ncbi:MAG: serine hydrolase [Bacteroidales bacterium]|nr:serine hydrolase [Bacteroidales bacterium]MCF8390953.1 serine hydrolase [Bacteroidales bacterium]
MKSYFIQGIILFIGFLFILNVHQSGYSALNDYKTAVQSEPAFLSADSLWVDSVLNSLSLEEKIAQLIMVPAYSYMGADHFNDINLLIERYNIGGIIFMKGSPVRQAKLTNHFQSLAKTPIMIALDAEWGLGMRLDSTISYPWQMMLGAIQDEALIYQMGLDIGKQLRRLGVHVNFAPVVDINNNPDNPVINARSFGEDRENVARKALMYARGLEDAGVIATLKHFPGHGDTDSDSHYSLPVIRHDYARLDSLELYPFKYIIGRGGQAIMSAHLNVLNLDSTENLASSLSPKVINDLLLTQLNFKGLVFTDALSMQAVSDFHKAGDLELMAYNAGNDILLAPSDVGKAISSISREVRRDRISEEELNRRCRKVLMAKYWLGLNMKQNVKTDSLIEDLNNPFYLAEKQKIIRNSFTLIKNEGDIIPVKDLEKHKIASISIGNGREDEFSKTLKLYTSVDNFYLSRDNMSFLKDTLLLKIKQYNTVFVSIQGTSPWPSWNYGVYPALISFLAEIEFDGNLILTLFGNPYALSGLQQTDNFDAILLAYEDTPEAKELAAQSLFGAFPINGKLPVSLGDLFPVNTGIEKKALDRLSYGFPEEVNMDSHVLKSIDTLMMEAFALKSMPGGQILVAKDGKVIFHKAYGYTSNTRRQKLLLTDLYDLASITKIVATIPALMKLEGEGMFSTENRLGEELNLPDSCNKNDILIKDILTHQSGLVAWIPFYYKTIEPLDSSESLLSTNFSYTYPYKIGSSTYANRNIVYKESVFSSDFSLEYPIKVAKDLYLRADFRDTIFSDIYNSELLEPVYRYSDLGYYIFKEMIEEKTGVSFYPFLYDNFYSKIGAETLGYLPLNRFPVDRIVPTENDMIFRRQLLQGYVHDPGAAMLGGIAGHAGVFSNANDLAKIMQMYLNGGKYGGETFLDSSILKKYTERVYTDNGNRRALGFDKPEPDEDKSGPTCASASLSSYGHSGFTGTLAWVDPEYDLIYIFLSNRIHPNQYNISLISENTRTKIQQVVYDSILREVP